MYDWEECISTKNYSYCDPNYVSIETLPSSEKY